MIKTERSMDADQKRHEEGVIIEPKGKGGVSATAHSDSRKGEKNPFEMLFVPMVLFMVIVAPTWIVMHYRSVNRSSSQLSEDDRQALEEMLVAVDQMADRIESLESILDADHPNWRQERGGQTQEEV
ncbi:MAG: hypothetical protein CM15mP103_05070 [Gammaproteobacteria bacterium]|nr:MAG: hypothetical protein CM15mP103_05070 [Gammaproteobacteria bacterium]